MNVYIYAAIIQTNSFNCIKTCLSYINNVDYIFKNLRMGAQCNDFIYDIGFSIKHNIEHIIKLIN